VPTRAPINVIVVDAAPLFRDGMTALLKDAGAFVLVFDFHPTLGPLMNFGPLMRFAHEGQGILKRMFGEPEMTKPAEKVEPKPVTMRRVVAKRPARRAPIRKAA